MQIGPLYLANAFYKNNKTPIQGEAIPKQSEVVLAYFNKSKEAVYAQVSLPSSIKFPQVMVKKIEPGHKRKFVFIVTSDDCKLKKFLVEIVDLNKTSKKRMREEVKDKGHEKDLEPSSKRQHLHNPVTDGSDCETEVEVEAAGDKETLPQEMNLQLKIYDQVEKKAIPWKEISEKNYFSVTLKSDHEAGFFIKNPNLKKQRVLCFLSSGNEILQVNGQITASLDYQQSDRLFTFTPKKELGSLLITYLTTDWPFKQGNPLFVNRVSARIV